MLAVIKTGGKQYLVQPGDKITIEKIDVEEGKKFTFDEVLLTVDDKDEVKVGTPLVTGAKVKAQVVAHGMTDKVTIHKYKAKKRYSRKLGHKQPCTQVEIIG